MSIQLTGQWRDSGTPMIPYSWLEEAAERIAPYIQKTPLTYDPNNDVYLKWENHQVTGSFKARGALNKILCLEEWERKRGLVAASAGNHGQGVALACQIVAAKAVIFISEQAVPAKIAAIKKYGAEVRLVPGGYGEAEKAGLEYAAEHDATWISPYNDGQVIAGQGTLGLELLQSLPGIPESAWLVPVGGGGLISGIGKAIDAYYPDQDDGRKSQSKPRLIAIQSEASPFFHSIFHTGSQASVQELPSLADGLAGPVEPNALTISIVKRWVDEFVLVSEEDIKQAISYAWKRYHEKIEGSAAVTLAAVLTNKVAIRPSVVILTGGNIQPEVHTQIVQAG
jgi:threonine dehydratase